MRRSLQLINHLPKSFSKHPEVFRNTYFNSSIHQIFGSQVFVSTVNVILETVI